MADKIIIGKGKEKEKKENEPIKDTSVNNFRQAPEIDNVPVQEPLYENVWGNDHSLLDKLNEEQLAERRLYTRAKYIQKIECNTILDSIESEPTFLTKPIVFMVIDISMGGIGIICEYNLDIGTILAFKVLLDQIPYEIKCEVVYCFFNEGKYRAGLKMAHKDKEFIRHLKILVARLSLQSKYGINTAKTGE